MITTDELKVQLAEYHTAVKDLEEALAIDASRKRVQELEHTMSRPGFYDDAELRWCPRRRKLSMPWARLWTSCS